MPSAAPESPEKAARRAEALRQYRILDTPPEELFDDLTLLASTICSTPIALISLVATDRQWFKSKVGIDVDGTSLENSFCKHELDQTEFLVVPDAKKDERFAENPLVTNDPSIRFYAGARLIGIEGVPIGRLCTVDHVPRELSEAQLTALGALARQVMALMELRRVAALLHDALDEKQAAVAEVKRLQGLLPICCYCKKVRDDTDYWHTVEKYISDHAEVRFSHGVCPDCEERAMRDMGLLPKES